MSRAFRGATIRLATELAARLDVISLLAVMTFISILAGARVELMGDGQRHLPAVVGDSSPGLGQPRWLLLSPLLYALASPFRVVGLVRDLEDAQRWFLSLNVALGAAYLLMLRRWLMALDTPVLQRAAALLGAGMAAPLFRLSSDIGEPLLGAVVVVGGLVFARSRPPRVEARGALVAVGSVAAGCLIYQGVALGLGFLPCVVSWRTLCSRRVLLGSLGILLFVPSAILGLLTLEGLTPLEAAHRAVSGSPNTLYLANLAQERPASVYRLGALVIGPPRALVPIPMNLGIRGSWQAIRDGTNVGWGALGLLAIGVSLLLVITGWADALRRRDWRLPVAYLAMAALPVVWYFQYAYLKFYVLLPVLVALAVGRVRSWGRAMIVALLIALPNGVAAVGEVAVSWRTHDVVRRVAAEVRWDAAWVTLGWGARPGWPGTVVSFMQALAGEEGRDLDDIVRRNNTRLLQNLIRGFCQSKLVLTDSLTQENEGAVRTLLGTFHVRLPVEALLWRADRGRILVDELDVRLFSYSETERDRICGILRGHR
jgi:hypothetical protein